MIANSPRRPNPPPPTGRAGSPLLKTPANLGSWRYAGRPRSRWYVAASVAVALAFHGGVFFGFRSHPKKAQPIHTETLLVLDLEPPKMEDLEEPTPEVTDEPAPPEDLGIQVPMQADSPQLPQPSDFVQQLDFASMNPQPDLDRPKVLTIPGTINRGGKIGEGLGKIFDLKDLDRQPVAIYQPAPTMPSALAQDGASGTVSVEFIVLADGTVSQPLVRDTTDFRFNEAAMRGVSRWKFKPGMKNGRKVNTRMLVPIVFRRKDGNE